MLFSQMFIQSVLPSDLDSQLTDPMLRAALEFGLQCMGVGTVLAQERIVIWRPAPVGPFPIDRACAPVARSLARCMRFV